MSALVPAEDIERIVGTRRDARAHIGRAVSTEQTFYVLHSQGCLDSGIDLRECPFSVALDKGVNPASGWEDIPVVLGLTQGRLMLMRRARS